MMNAQGPVYIHGTEGKDRTGFVCIVLEALAESSYDEMLDEFMISYKNYYSVDQNSTPERYKAIVELYFDDYICCLCETDTVGPTENVNYSENAENYLRNGGMTETEIAQLKTFLMR